MWNAFKDWFSARFFYYWQGLYFNYRIRWTDWVNEYDRNLPWRIREEWYVALRFSPHFFMKGQLYHDGNFQDHIVVLGILFAKGYVYDSRPEIECDGRD